VIIETIEERSSRTVHAVESGRVPRCRRQQLRTVTVRRLSRAESVTCDDCRAALGLGRKS
jgi:hypothetical protein